MSGNLRRAAILAASGTAYVASVVFAYNYATTAGKKISETDETTQTNAATSSSSNDGTTFSYLTNPNRTDTFQQIAYAYDDQISKDELVMGINLLRRSLLYFHAKGDVLEVGAGTGRNLSYYPLGESTVRKIVLTDTSDKMLLRAKQKLVSMSEGKRKRFETIEADASNLYMYEDDTFDTIVDTFGLCSFDDPVAVLHELQRVCKPNGKILLLEHGRTKTYDGLSRYLDKNAERHAKNWGCVWNRDIDSILVKAGLEVETLDTWHFGTTYYVVCRPGKNDGATGGLTPTSKNGVVVGTSSATTVSPFVPLIQFLPVACWLPRSHCGHDCERRSHHCGDCERGRETGKTDMKER